MTDMLTADQRSAFAADGLVQLPAALEPAAARQMCDKVWDFLAAHQDVERYDPATWTTARPTGFNRLSRTGVLDQLWTASVRDVLSELLGTDDQHHERPRVLMTFPQPDVTWEVPSAGWHFDYTPLQHGAGLRAVQVFALLSDVEPQGGGTLVLAGSHRLVSGFVARTGRQPAPRVVRDDLSARHPWLAALWGKRTGSAAGIEDRSAPRVDARTEIDGTGLRVTEMTGSTGDIYVMSSDCFHAAAPNTRAVPRVMCTSLVVRSAPSV
jgi:hypothetical protein